MFYATDEKGVKILPVCHKKDGFSVYIFKKETFINAKTLSIQSVLTEADANDEGFYIVPRSISVLGDILTKFTERDDCEYISKRPIMSCYCVKTPKFCGLIRIERSYRIGIKVAVKNNRYSISAEYDFTAHDTVYDDIRFEVIELPKSATAGDFAAAERSLRLERGEITTLKEKCEREKVEYARRHPLIRIRMGWKDSPAPIKHQTVENEPPMHVAVTFARVRDIADELKRQGVEGADLQLVGWNISGHDGRFPQLLPIDKRLGGKEEFDKTVEYVKKLGYRISLHTNLIDSYEIADCFSWDKVAVQQDGEYIQRGDYSGGYAYIVCPRMQAVNSKMQLDTVKSLNVNGMHFTDVISIVYPDVCHSKAHPSTTKDGIAVSLEIMKEIRATLGAFSSEGAMDFALPELDYALYVSFGDGFGATEIPTRDGWLPFYELTYHGIVLYNPLSPTINFTIKNARDRLLFILRGGRPSFYIYSRFRSNGKDWMGMTDLNCKTDDELTAAVSAIKKGQDIYKELADRQFIYMKDYEIVGNGVEAAIYDDGVIIAANFSDTPKEYRGQKIPAGEYIIL